MKNSNNFGNFLCFYPKKLQEFISSFWVKTFSRLVKKTILKLYGFSVS